MRVGSLFSGIGGLDLGLERAGMTVVWQSEIDPYASRVLAKHWPTVPNLSDITTIDWSTVEPVDLICGGYPCQPFSLAGSRAGERDARHLWPYFADALRELRPRWALLENVSGHLSLGFGRVLGDLAELGYDADWRCVSAASVGAHHLRNRLFVVAHANRDGLRQQPIGQFGRGRSSVAECDGATRSVAYTDDPVSVSQASPRRDEVQRGAVRQLVVARRRAHVAATDEVGRDRWAGELGAGRWPQPTDGREDADTDRFAAFRSPVSRRERDPWPAEPQVGRVAHGVPSRVDRLKCLGNAVVPQVAEWVGRRIMEAAA